MGVQKQPSESKLFTMPFSNKMTTGETITGIQSITVYPSVLTATFDSISGQNVLVLAAGGLNHKQYKLTIVVSTSLGQILENEGYIKVEEI